MIWLWSCPAWAASWTRWLPEVPPSWSVSVVLCPRWQQLTDQSSRQEDLWWAPLSLVTHHTQLIAVCGPHSVIRRKVGNLKLSVHQPCRTAFMEKCRKRWFPLSVYKSCDWIYVWYRPVVLAVQPKGDLPVSKHKFYWLFTSLHMATLTSSLLHSLSLVKVDLLGLHDLPNNCSHSVVPTLEATKHGFNC